MIRPKSSLVLKLGLAAFAAVALSGIPLNSLAQERSSALPNTAQTEKPLPSLASWDGIKAYAHDVWTLMKNDADDGHGRSLAPGQVGEQKPVSKPTQAEIERGKKICQAPAKRLFNIPLFRTISAEDYNSLHPEVQKHCFDAK